MTNLITRLSKLDAPDREADNEIHLLFFADDIYGSHVPPYTASVDAVIALAEKEFPGWTWSLFPHAAEIRHPKIRAKDQMAGGFNTATALCIALLRAKEASKS